MKIINIIIILKINYKSIINVHYNKEYKSSFFPEKIKCSTTWRHEAAKTEETSMEQLAMVMWIILGETKVYTLYKI